MFSVVVRWVLLLVLISSVAPAPAQAQLRHRKSIDQLTAAELMDYMHAVKKLRERSETNPGVLFSYAHMAGIHNLPGVFNGACEHWNHKFLAWHRALLLNYEDALRAIDPPRTSNVTLPYWNWSEKPSGKRFAVAFENDAGAVAAKYGQPIPADLLQQLFKTRNTAASGPVHPWSEIAPIATGSDIVVFTGTSGNHGALEHPPHDDLHGFIGGDLCCTSSAANDAIFWSYHAFVDLIWWWRQSQITETPTTCLDCPMRGIPIKTALGTQLNTDAAQPPRLKHVFDAKKLNYTYDFEPPPPPAGPVIASAGARSFSSRLPTLAEIALGTPDYVWSFKTRFPATGSDTTSVTLRNVDVAKNFAYIAFVYVHPSNVAYKRSDPAFRDSYLVGHYSQWINSHANHGASAKRTFVVSFDRGAYPNLTAAAGGEVTVSVAIHVQSQNPQPRPSAAASSKETLVRTDTRIGSVGLGSSR
jgi:tyrosinase